MFTGWMFMVLFQLIASRKKVTTQIISNKFCLLSLVIWCHFLIGVGEQMTSVYTFHRRSYAKLTRPGVGLEFTQRRLAQNEKVSGLWMSK